MNLSVGYERKRMRDACRCGVWWNRIDKVENEYIRGSLKVELVDKKLRNNRLTCYGHVMRRDKQHVFKKVLRMEVDRYESR